MSPAERRIATSVLVIGSGGSGLRAAIQLAERGTDVLVVDKRPSVDAHTTLAAGGINAALATMDPEDSWQQHAADTLKESYFLAEPEDHGTGVAGLYAIGEAASGLHGANRLGGNALIELLVYGRIVGDAAADYSADLDAQSGELSILPSALLLRLSNRVYAGDLAETASLVAEATTIGEATGSSFFAHYGALVLEPWRGREVETRQVITQDMLLRGGERF
jgi:succinate dehydrogenase/fumarate reductase flavoprotein subunit